MIDIAYGGVLRKDDNFKIFVLPKIREKRKKRNTKIG